MSAGQIRTLKGFDRFLLPPTLKDFTALATHGPIVQFVSTTFWSDAILITKIYVAHVPDLVDAETLYSDPLPAAYAAGKISLAE